MQKIISLLLSLALLLSVGAVSAEEAVKAPYEIRYDEKMVIAAVIPDGYTVLRQDVSDGLFYFVLVPENTAGVYYALSVMSSEEYSELDRLNDLPADQVEAFASTLYEDMNAPTVEKRQTGLGTDLILVNENGIEGDDYAILSTLYKGYELDLLIIPQDNCTVTENDIDVAVQFYTDLDFRF